MRSDPVDSAGVDHGSRAEPPVDRVCASAASIVCSKVGGRSCRPSRSEGRVTYGEAVLLSVGMLLGPKGGSQAPEQILNENNGLSAVCPGNHNTHYACNRSLF